MEAIFQGKLPNETEILSKNEKFNDLVITSLRTMWGLNTEKLKEDFGSEIENYFLSIAKKFIKQKLMIKLSNNFFKFSLYFTKNLIRR